MLAMDLPALIAHRLGRAYGPDGSRATLERTLAGPVDGVEVDICLTADERLICLHDPLLPLGTTLDGWAHERTAGEIRGAHLRDRGGNPTDERPLGLDELLELVPDDLLLQLDLKAHADRRLARRAASLLCERLGRHRARALEVISFHSDACAIAAVRGVPARLVIWADYEPAALAAWAERWGVIGVSVEHFLLTQQLVRSLRAAGLSVNTGTINRRELLAAILPLAPDAICTDRPHELREELTALCRAAARSPVSLRAAG
jgi:glycerophosphoryl diester phosphodiesterase